MKRRGKTDRPNGMEQRGVWKARGTAREQFCKQPNVTRDRPLPQTGLTARAPQVPAGDIRAHRALGQTLSTVLEPRFYLKTGGSVVTELSSLVAYKP